MDIDSQNGSGVGDALFTRGGNFRSDCRMIAKLISCGVVDEQRAGELLAKAFDLAETAAMKGNVRQFVAAMKVPLAAARLGILQEQPQAEHVANGAQQRVVVVLPSNGREDCDAPVVSQEQLSGPSKELTAGW